MLISRRHREAAIANSNDNTEVIPQIEAETKPTPHVLRGAIDQMTHYLTLPFGNLPPQPPRSRWRKMVDRVQDALMDSEWHQAARRTAGTALLWGFTGTAFLVFGKALAWVLFL